MGWYNYYNLYEKYKGDLSKATSAELNAAARSNPNNPIDARRIAEAKYKGKYTEKFLRWCRR